MPYFNPQRLRIGSFLSIFFNLQGLAQGWGFALSLKIAHFKERPWANNSCRSLQKSNRKRFAFYKWAMWVIRSWFEQIACKKQANRLKNSYFSYVFDSFFPILCFKANPSRCSSLIRSFLKSNLSDSLPSLFTREWLCP